MTVESDDDRLSAPTVGDIIRQHHGLVARVRELENLLSSLEKQIDQERGLADQLAAALADTQCWDLDGVEAAFRAWQTAREPLCECGHGREEHASDGICLAMGGICTCLAYAAADPPAEAAVTPQ